MSPHGWSLRNPWAVLVGALLVAVVGLRAFFTMPTEYFPDTNPPQAAIIIVEPGAAAVDVSRRITEVVEKELASIPGLTKLSSASRDEVASINAQFNYGKPVGQVVVDIQNALSRVRAQLPSDILEPRIYPVTDATRPVLTLSLRPKAGSSLDLAHIRLLADNDIKDFLLNLPGVADVDTFGGHRMQVNLWLDRDRLEAYGLTPQDVMRAVQVQNITTPAGLMENEDGEALVKTIGEFRDLRDIRDCVIRRKAGADVRVQDVARVELGIEDLRSLYHGNGEPAVAINVLRADGGNVMSVIRTVKGALSRMEKRWPDIHFEITNDQQPLIDRNTQGMRASLYASIALTVVIIFLFLADIRSSTIALVSIPLSFMFAVAVLGLTGHTLNIVTLSGLIIATGMVVDATVVVVENIHRHQKTCPGDARQCVEGAVGEILLSISAGMLTTVVMLVPIMFSGGYVQQVLRRFTLTLAYALVGSLLVAVFVVPPLALKLIRGGDAAKRRRNVLERLVLPFGKGVDALANFYVRVLRAALHRRWLAMLLALGCFVLTMKIVPPIIGRELMPPMDTGIMNIRFELPPSASVAHVEKTLTEVEKIIRQEPSVRMISSTVGSEPGEISFGAGGQTAQTAFLIVTLTTRDQRDRTIWEIEDEWREKISALGGIRSLQVYEYGATPMATSRAPIDLVVMGGHRPEDLSAAAARIQQSLEGLPGLVDVVPGWWLDKEEVHVRVDPRTARLYGVTPADVASILRVAVGGVPASGLRLKGFLDVPIRVAYEDAWVRSPERLAQIPIPTPKGSVPLRTLAAIEPSTTQTVITREDLENTIDITAYNRTRRISQVLGDIGARLKKVSLPGSLHIKVSGTAADMHESMQRVMKAVLLGLVLLVVLLVGTFRSFSLPLPILVAIPLAIIGSMWGLLLLGKPMCMPAMMGILLLAGVVINNSIFLIDFIRQALDQGMDRDQALEQAVRLRLRPVLMTTISTFVGMLPMILETAVGLERMSPLATAAGFGLLVGTVMTLVITPVTYTLLDDLGRLVARLWR
ncbi:heavy metal efflux pump, CzcA family [Desulfacinum hydrothermale DSM 13146]|uniref:Heavy metal efflux pump, CzcA family n=1 Tax=Desulfacinum hydrothermale DSM 13146 TaxID=1121390 RepID=A0A1W1XNY6_9BACT|nr:efflux RND transporter permease subunit [Desulfacinum hydrothermale]SMC25689.1 heavy metal efflux pump, CzcA family [Desulfacinum hydrothermale DSM 13146]